MNILNFGFDITLFKIYHFGDFFRPGPVAAL